MTIFWALFGYRRLGVMSHRLPHATSAAFGVPRVSADADRRTNVSFVLWCLDHLAIISSWLVRVWGAVRRAPLLVREGGRDPSDAGGRLGFSAQLLDTRRVPPARCRALPSGRNTRNSVPIVQSGHQCGMLLTI
jgi:hypothetical protein